VLLDERIGHLGDLAYQYLPLHFPSSASKRYECHFEAAELPSGDWVAFRASRTRICPAILGIIRLTSILRHCPSCCNMEPSPPDSNEGFNSSPSETTQPSQPLPPTPTNILPDIQAQDPNSQLQGQQTLSNANGNRLTVPAACVACRTKHLKCDGTRPCSRCNTHGIECSYVRSRRGYKGPRRAVKPAAGVTGKCFQEHHSP
jgi:hypothetical protein